MLYLQKRNQTYYFRIRIPHDIAHWFEVSEIKQSLRIKSHQEAKRFARIQASRAERLFSLIRSGVVNGDQVQALIEHEFPGNKTKQLGKDKPLRLVDVVQAYVNEHKLTGPRAKAALFSPAQGQSLDGRQRGR